MLYLKRLSLLQFKSYENQYFEFAPGLNLLAGRNGVGKTNVLDAVHYLCLTKSHFLPQDKQNVQHGHDFFRIEGVFQRGEQQLKVACKYGQGQRKSLSCNGQAYGSNAEHIGLLPLIMLAPDDQSLITEGSELRRQFLDLLLSQSDPQYLQQLMRYNRLLDQRNALLKQYAGQMPDAALLETYDQAMAAPCAYLFAQRQAIAQTLHELFEADYRHLSQGQEQVRLEYRSALQEQDWLDLQRQARSKDCYLQRTTQGIHRDDLLLYLGDQPLKQYASQGQRKTAFVALKLAQYRLLASRCSHQPLLLLDDICDKLDARRVEQLLQLVTSQGFGQVFITDTQSARIQAFCEKAQLSLNLISFSNDQ
jgi:DNA replication and repair protein RecF